MLFYGVGVTTWLLEEHVSARVDIAAVYLERVVIVCSRRKRVQCTWKGG